jgi:hypothetical protein
MTRHPTRWALLIVAALSLPLSGCGDNPDTAQPTSDTPSSAAGATSSSATSSDAGSSATPQHLVEGPATSLEPGTYQFSVVANPGVETPDALVEVPSGFDDEAAWYVVSHDQQEFLGLWTVGLVDRDACPSGTNQLFDPGPSVEDLADALVAQKSTRATTPKPVKLAGYKGLYVELTSPHDISGCEQTGHLWGNPGGRGIYNDGQVDLVWILDVDGQRLVVNAAYTPKSSASDIDKLTSMVESLKFAGNAP